jgi:hypothetical protein
VIDARKTTSELECVILTTVYFVGAENTDSWHARKVDLQCAFPLDVPMVYSPKLTFIANCNNPIGVGLAPGESICFGSLEFTIDRFGRLSLSPKEDDSSAVFIGMLHSGSPSWHTTFEDSSDEGGTTLGGEGSSGSPSLQGCNMATPTVPIITTPAPENTPALLTIPTISGQSVAP